jgi:hypothetical protein
VEKYGLYPNMVMATEMIAQQLAILMWIVNGIPAEPRK